LQSGLLIESLALLLEHARSLPAAAPAATRFMHQGAGSG
jgi:hypothetical protein